MMNPIALELAKKVIHKHQWDVGTLSLYDEQIEKFAELIVEECAAHLHRRGVEGFGILEERNLKEHFGVE
jgi:hypothetical protein